jgi:hypothetical protein
MHADVVISLNQKPEEYDREAIRLFLVKNRGEVSRKVVHMYTNFSKGTFYRHGTDTERRASHTTKKTHTKRKYTKRKQRSYCAV